MARKRGLTEGEMAVACEAFGERLAYKQIRFFDGAASNPIAKAAFRNGNTAITLRRSIYFAPERFLPDFSIGKPAARGLFIHELTHVWQYDQLGTAYFLAKYVVQFARVRAQAWRMYEYVQGVTPFHGAMLEQQAEMVGNYAEAKADSDAAKMALIEKNLAGSGMFAL